MERMTHFFADRTGGAGGASLRGFKIAEIFGEEETKGIFFRGGVGDNSEAIFLSMPERRDLTWATINHPGSMAQS